MRHDPYWSQKATKSSNMERILRAIRDKHPTFGELLEEVSLSRPILSKYLRELQKEGRITRVIHGRRIQYHPTDKGKALEQSRIESVANAFQMMKSFASNYSEQTARTLSRMAKLAKEDPELFEQSMYWSSEFTQLLLTNDFLHWVQKHPGEEGGRLLEREFRKRLGKREPLSVDLSEILKIMREIFATEGPRGAR